VTEKEKATGAEVTETTARELGEVNQKTTRLQQEAASEYWESIYVFEYFRQADSTITRTFCGLGLGLAIIRHLTELHGGTVQAESLGEG